MTIFETLPREQQILIDKYLELVIEANQHVNLTRITSPKEAKLLHIEDSLTALDDLCSAPPGRYGDLGSGGGFPGVPLAIATGRQTTLIDARQKKMLVVEGIIAQLGLQGHIIAYAGRAELLARTQSGEFSALTARALAKLHVLMELASPLLQMGGRLICYKARPDKSEIEAARRVERLTGMKLLNTRTFTLGDDMTRTIVTFEKSTVPTVKLPRPEGQAQKTPLAKG